MRYLIITIVFSLAVVGIGCASLTGIQNANCEKNRIDLKNSTVEIPEMQDFEVVSFHRLNNNILIAHTKENVGIDLQISDETDESFAKTKKSFYADEGELGIFGGGNKFKLKTKNVQTEPVGNTRYVYIYRIGNLTAAFTQYDYTDGKYDERVADIIDSISIKPKQGR